jgi:hypothetical protein
MKLKGKKYIPLILLTLFIFIGIIFTQTGDLTIIGLATHNPSSLETQYNESNNKKNPDKQPTPPQNESIPDQGVTPGNRVTTTTRNPQTTSSTIASTTVRHRGFKTPGKKIIGGDYRVEINPTTTTTVPEETTTTSTTQPEEQPTSTSTTQPEEQTTTTSTLPTTTTTVPEEQPTSTSTTQPEEQTTTTSTLPNSTTTSTIPPAPEFPIEAIPLTILLTTPAFAYLILKKE